METTEYKGAREAAGAAKNSAISLGCTSAEQRNGALLTMADALEAHATEILSANDFDISSARKTGTRENLIDRLRLDEHRIRDCARGLRALAAQPDPLGEIVDGRTLPGGIEMKQVRVPLGVVGMIYEARPNVTVDAAGIGVKTGNAMLLRGGSSAKHSNDAIVSVLRVALLEAGLPANSVQTLDATDRASADELMSLSGLVDVLIPRGGAGLISSVVAHSKVPVIETGTGNCHIYVHTAASLEMATAIVVNAKCQRNSVCNAAESLLVDREVARVALGIIAPALVARGVTCICDSESHDILFELGIACETAEEQDFYTEYLDAKISIKVVSGVDEAVAHINTYGTHHSDSIVTSDIDAASVFTRGVDSACVYVNASTRFTDGAMFGLGAELGISTQKLHARGPFGLVALTSTKYILQGNGQVRG
ncbi:MAG: glutamate-5-semialdehyde dehydrogenase [Coriobacteriia bacterium]|nr:glutamate-5-semialdehyde dehydrogenase [Coriobacteriia bacterium]